jgi:hypothetical protein
MLACQLRAIFMAAARLPYWCDLWNNLHFWLLGIRKVKGRMSGMGINSVKGVVELAGFILIVVNQCGRIKVSEKQLSFEVGVRVEPMTAQTANMAEKTAFVTHGSPLFCYSCNLRLCHGLQIYKP